MNVFRNILSINDLIEVNVIITKDRKLQYLTIHDHLKFKDVVYMNKITIRLTGDKRGTFEIVDGGVDYTYIDLFALTFGFKEPLKKRDGHGRVDIEYGCSREVRDEILYLPEEELIDLFDLQDFARVPFDGLSTGTKQKLSLAKSLVNDPELLFLDEPTVGLDPDVANRVHESILNIHKKKGTTILMTTHNMKEAEALCEKIVFIKDGIIKAFGIPQGLKEELRLGDRITIFFDGAVSAPSFKEMSGIYNLEIGDGQCRIIVDDHRKRLPQILDLFVRSGIRIINLSIQESDLEDVFITLAR